MPLTLTAPQRRVLGVLMEKALATPAYYPMTLNAIVAAANQKSNRSPVTDYAEGEIGRALHELMEMKLVAQAPPEPGARSNRFKHEVDSQLGWNRRQRAVMAELLLRGPQTVGELRTRINRMVALPELDAVASVVQELAEMDPPVVRELPRQPGRSATRFAHTLFPDDEAPAGSTSAVATSVWSDSESSPQPLADRIGRLEAQVEELRTELAALREKVGLAGAPRADS